MYRLCFVAYNATPVLFPEEGTGIGGAETGAWTVARGMSRLTACQASFCLRHTRNLRISEKDGVHLFWRIERFRDIRRYVSDCLDFSTGFPRLKQFRLGLLWRVPLLAFTWAFRSRDLPACQADPRLAGISCDVFICLGVTIENSQVVATARSLGKPVVLYLQANTDIPPLSGPSPSENSREAIARFVFKYATSVIVQTQYQKEQLAIHYERSSTHMPNPIDQDQWQVPEGSSREYVLWVGRADDFHKRPLLCIEIARNLPELPFLMIMNPSDPQIAQQVQQSKPPNVTLRELVPHHEMPQVYARAKAFLSTGHAAYEGFPNVFLQAAATGTPIVTMFDFDGFVSQSRAGVVVGDSVPAAVEALSQLAQTPRSESDRTVTKDYLTQHHDLGRFCHLLEKIVTGLLAPSC